MGVKSLNPIPKKKQERKKKITINQIKEGIKGGGGTDIATAAWIKKHYGISVDRSTVSGYVRRNLELQEAKEEADEEILDIAIIKLRELILKGDKGAIFFLIKYKGRKRGFISQYSAEIANKEGESFKVSTEDPELKNMSIQEIMALARKHHDDTYKAPEISK